MDILLYLKMSNQQGPTVYMEHCSDLCGSLDVGVEWSLDTCVHMAKSLWCSPETITMLLTDHSSIQKKKLYTNGNLYTYHSETPFSFSTF